MFQSFTQPSPTLTGEKHDRLLLPLTWNVVSLIGPDLQSLLTVTGKEWLKLETARAS
jgi:hypothetical protein